MKNAADIAYLVSESNKDIAEMFNITLSNNPKHPSFYTREWVLSDMARGEEYFIFEEEAASRGCAAFEHRKTRRSHT